MMSKIFNVLAVMFSLLVVCSGVHAFERGDALVVYRVINEEQDPVANAEVYCTAWWPDSGFTIGEKYGKYSGMTDTNGIVHVSIVAFYDMRCRIGKDGHYKTSFPYVFSGKSDPEIIDGRWQPWGVTNTVFLKRIRNPVPMYAKHVDAIVPVLDNPVGYDLEKGDWVDPHGMGVVSDFVFSVSGTYSNSSNRDLNMVVSFSNPHDGLQVFKRPVHNELPIGSELVSDHEAPSTEYEPTYRYLYRMLPTLSGRVNVEPRFGQNAYFRVRSKVDDEGKLIESTYGKIYGDLFCRFRGAEEVMLKFTYYWNPKPNERNVEFDTSNNLFGWTYRDSGQGNFRP